MAKAFIDQTDPHIVYHVYGDNHECLYIGCSGEVLSRMAQHARVVGWYSDIKYITLDHYPTRGEALNAESIAIELEHPIYNRRLTPKHGTVSRYTNYDCRCEACRHAMRRSAA